MDQISRDPEDLLRQAMSEHHYPDGFVLFLGTLFAPTQDRDEPGRGFTHKVGDIVRIAEPRLGTLVNRVRTSAEAPAWTPGLAALLRNPAGRGLLHRYICGVTSSLCLCCRYTRRAGFSVGRDFRT